MDMSKIAEKNRIFECLSGSHAYGMALPTSDVDYRGIFVAPPVSVVTPFFPVEQTNGPGDRVLYEVSKFLKLAIDQNPNIMELLWVDDSDIIFRTPTYNLLRENRYSLLSSKVVHTYTGYAFQQLKRIKGHSKWINNPQPEKPPRQYDYLRFLLDVPHALRGHFSLHRLYDNVYAVYRNVGSNICDANGVLIQNVPMPANEEPVTLAVFAREDYERDFNNWKSYWDWKKNRNKKRSELEEKHGYDTKHGSHLVRLLRMGKEILRDGVVNVKRPDAEELLAIRNGSMSYDEIIQYADEVQAEIYELAETTQLPKTVSPKFAASLLMEVYEYHWNVNLR